RGCGRSLPDSSPARPACHSWRVSPGSVPPAEVYPTREGTAIRSRPLAGHDPQPRGADAERLAGQRAVSLNVDVTDIGKDLQQVAAEVDVVDCRLPFDFGAADEDVGRGLLSGDGIEGCVVQEEDIAEREPAFRDRLVKETL